MRLLKEIIKSRISSLESMIVELKDKYRMELAMKNIKLKKKNKLKELLLMVTNKKTIYVRFDGNWQEYKSVKNGYLTKMTFWNTGGNIRELAKSIQEFIVECEREANRISTPINFEKTNRLLNVKIVDLESTIE